MRSLNSTGCKEGFFIRPPRLRKIELPISILYTPAPPQKN